MSARPQRRSGNLSALKVELWAAIRATSAIIADPETPTELRVRAVSAMATASSVYARILYDHEIEQRLSALEASTREPARNGDYG
jgi:hypothetical protein